MPEALNEPQRLASDLLVGAEAIALFVYGSSDPKTVKRVYYQGARRQLPVFFTGRIMNARKSELANAMSAATREVA